MPTTLRLKGVHHVTAITTRAGDNHRFYTGVLGMRLVKKTVNQDDTSAYHLFYADGIGSPGSDLTFFDWPTQAETRGVDSVTRTSLRVRVEALPFWTDRLAGHGIPALASRAAGRLALDFEDPEGQRLRLVGDDTGEAHPWPASPVTQAEQIRGLGPIELTMRRAEQTASFLTDVLGMAERAGGREEGVRVLLSPEGSGSAAEVHLREAAGERARPGVGGVHHVAFRIDDDAYEAWVARYERLGVRSSGPVDRFYFRSLYAREPNGILIELATDGPGFAIDEPLETMGEHLSLPPFLEPRRAEIERGLMPLEVAPHR